MNVLFVTHGNRKSASTRLRVLNILPYLEREGIDTEVMSVSNLRDTVGVHNRLGDVILLTKLLAVAPKYDAIYISRLPFPEIYNKLLFHQNQNIIFDFDDAIYSSPFYMEGRGQNERRVRSMLRHAKVVIAGSPILKDYAKSYSNNIEVLPTAIPQEKYPQPSDRLTDGNEVTIGWIGNPTNLPYLAQIEDQLDSILSEHESVRLLIITSETRPITPLEDKIGDSVVYKTWSLERERELLQEVDIGIRPLMDTEWARGKGGYTSVVQMMACGIPTIVSSVGMLPNIVQHGVSGYLVENENEWSTYIERFIENRDLIKQMGCASWKRVDELGFWTADYANQFQKILQDLQNEDGS